MKPHFDFEYHEPQSTIHVLINILQNPVLSNCWFTIFIYSSLNNKIIIPYIVSLLLIVTMGLSPVSTIHVFLLITTFLIKWGIFIKYILLIYFPISLMLSYVNLVLNIPIFFYMKLYKYFFLLFYVQFVTHWRCTLPICQYIKIVYIYNLKWKTF